MNLLFLIDSHPPHLRTHHHQHHQRKRTHSVDIALFEYSIYTPSRAKNFQTQILFAIRNALTFVCIYLCGVCWTTKNEVLIRHHKCRSSIRALYERTRIPILHYSPSLCTRRRVNAFVWRRIVCLFMHCTLLTFSRHQHECACGLCAVDWEGT